MAARSTNLSSGQQPQTAKQESSKRWLTRQLLKPVPVPWQGKGTGEKLDTSRLPSLDRPRTAPSPAMSVPPMHSSFPLPFERPSMQHDSKFSVEFPRAGSGVVRDVNAWLDASNKPASPLMSGLPYWKEGPLGAKGQSHGQFAMPIVHEPERRPSTSSNQPLKAFCRRAKKMQVRMPSLKRTCSQSAMVQKQINRRSTSTPMLAARYSELPERKPTSVSRFGSVRVPVSRSVTGNASQPAQSNAWMRVGPSPRMRNTSLDGNSASASVRGPEYHMDRQTNAAFGQGGYTIRVVPREDSMGSLQFSDAPTYFTGPAPPSYRSRPESILTTSSFGCIDGMNPEQRQLSQQRAQRRRGMKGKLKKFAQKALFTK
ncbi:hypothetical protein P280DRAFT_468708 [Massarina eburnea CBS 473.64]|uniref:Uncharacterized protein n=1 Tax=Massarina eburnea CBS 473.64 TaxID=1395130 RepID=A0A6A6S0D3_9PLEO|nr:hypothetical protein P280DRAFT_468708 [Massarina eburnea CBS 473.64]